MKHQLRMRTPALKWQDAFPLGNGKTGALVFGHIGEERVIFNHENLYLHAERPGLSPMAACLPAYRKLLLAGAYEEARALWEEAFEAARQAPAYIAPYQPAMELRMAQDTRGPTLSYEHTLCLGDGVDTVRWQDDDGNHARESFCSTEHGVFVMRLRLAKASPMRVWLQGVDMKPGASMGSGVLSGMQTAPLTAAASQTDTGMRLACRWNGGTLACYGALAVHGAAEAAVYEDGALRVIPGEETLILVALSDASAEQAQESLSCALVEAGSLYDAHVNAHGALMSRSGVSLRHVPDSLLDLENEKLLLDSQERDVCDTLLMKMYAYGQYLLVSGSIGCAMPLNLQGIWNGDYAPAWSSDFHNDENVQMCYWPALTAGFAESTLPFFDYYDSFLEDYRANARAVFGCRGILAGISQTDFGGIATNGAVWANWTAGAGWLAQLYYDYYLYTNDRAFLKERALPFLREVALFYLDFILVQDGKAVFAPSLSPENTPLGCGTMTVVNATMDVAVAKEALTNFLKGCADAGTSDPLEPEVSRLLACLPEYEVNEEGALREWLYPGLEDNDSHRHESHLYPVFPGHEILRGDPLHEAAAVSLRRRQTIGLRAQSGWSFAHMANAYARVSWGDEAYTALQCLVRACTGINLFTYHNDWRAQGLSMFWGHGVMPPFQIDANMGLMAAIQEMLIDSTPEHLYILPAPPSHWDTGSFEGLQARCGVRVNAKWAPRHVEITLHALRDTAFTLHMEETERPLRLGEGETETLVLKR